MEVENRPRKDHVALYNDLKLFTVKSSIEYSTQPAKCVGMKIPSSDLE